MSLELLDEKFGGSIEKMTRFMRDRYREGSPEAFRMAYPRQIRPPKDYCDPDEFAVMACSTAEWIQSAGAQSDLITTAMHVIATEAINMKAPLFFPSTNLLDALMRTEAPTSLKLQEICWPLPVLIFMLPREFSRRYFGHVVPFTCIARTAANYECSSKLIINGRGVPGISITNDEKPDSEMYYSGGTVFEGNAPAHYAQHAPTQDHDVADCMAAPLDYYNMFSQRPDPSHDVSILHKIAALNLNLLMAMIARPELIDREQRLLRPKQVHAGQTVHEALWSPRMIGEKFALRKNPGQGGTHASPHVHWRIAHWRQQRYGPKLCYVKPKWIIDVQVGLKAA